MNQGVQGLLTVCILDYNRPKEAELCLRSVHDNILVSPLQVLFLSNGGDQSAARSFYDQGLIDTLVLNKKNLGCGIAMRQAAQAATTEWVMMVQADQFAVRPLTQAQFDNAIAWLAAHPETLYLDLAGDQGRGSYSERAHLINRRRYLDTPGLDDVIGGPGPYAQSKWTERHMQDYMRAANLQIGGVNPPIFADNGAWSEREYPAEYGVDGVAPLTRHRTDTKRLWVLRPFGRRAGGFPNLNLSEDEWAIVLAGQWPAEGRIPEADQKHSFLVWPE